MPSQATLPGPTGHVAIGRVRQIDHHRQRSGVVAGGSSGGRGCIQGPSHPGGDCLVVADSAVALASLQAAAHREVIPFAMAAETARQAALTQAAGIGQSVADSLRDPSLRNEAEAAIAGPGPKPILGEEIGAGKTVDDGGPTLPLGRQDAAVDGVGLR